MSGEANKKLKKLICAGIVALVLAGMEEARASIVEVTDVQIIRGELVGGWFQAIEVVDEIIVGDVFVITPEVTNFGSETEYVLNLYGWDLSPENRVEVIGTSGLCATYHDLQPGESTGLLPFCLEQAFKAEETGGVTMNIYVKDWVFENLCQYTFEFIVIPEPAMIYYVDADANGVNDGSSWTDAYNYLQDALTDANSVTEPVEIRVAQGIYKPDQGEGITPGDRTATFHLKSGVAIKGGYAGLGTPDPNGRDIDAYETILSGDLDGNDVEVIDPCDLLSEPSRAENSYHVVTGSGTDPNTILDGFTITGGNANSSSIYTRDRCGGGMYNDCGSPTLVKCVFSDNSAGIGGGMYNSGGGPMLTNCTFSGNSAIGGGGMHNGSSPMVTQTLTNCTFIGNSARTGGGMSHNSGSPTLTNCTFIGNSAEEGGGMLVMGTCCPMGIQTVINCIFSGNSATYGGGVYSTYDDLILTNCTFSGNSAEHGGGIHNEVSSVTLTNCIFWGDDAAEEISGSPSDGTYSNIDGGYTGTGNIDADPCFVELGYWADKNDPNIVVEPNAPNAVWIDGDYHLLPGSPCIDAGDPNYIPEPNETDLDGKPRVIGGRIDMGAYEYSPPIPAEVRIVPRTINLTSKGKWISCYIWLPEDCDVADIDPNSVVLEDEIQAESLVIDEQEQIAIVRFSRLEVQDILAPGEVGLTVSGKLTDGTVFEGRDIIKVIDKGRKK